MITDIVPRILELVFVTLAGRVYCVILKTNVAKKIVTTQVLVMTTQVIVYVTLATLDLIARIIILAAIPTAELTEPAIPKTELVFATSATPVLIAK